MKDNDLEARLQDYYTDFTPRDSTRAVDGVGRVVAGARVRRQVNPWAWMGQKWLRGVVASAAAVAVVAALAVATLPVWHGSASVAVPRDTANSSPSAQSSPGASQGASPAPLTSPPAGMASKWGTARNGWLWAIHGSSLEISKDHGRTWHASPLPEYSGSGAAQPEDVAIVDASQFWVLEAVRFAGMPDLTTELMYRTADAGVSWQLTKALTFPVGNKTGEYLLESMSVVDSEVGFAVFTPLIADNTFQPSTVMRTLDGGATWSVTATETVLDGGIYAVDRNTLWMTTSQWAGRGSSAALQLSHDAGATWTSVPVPGLSDISIGNLSLAHPTFLNANEGFLVAYVDVLGVETRYYRTVDGGHTWSFVATRAGQAAAVTFIDATHWIEGEPLGTGREMTSDAGKTWTTFTALDPEQSLVFQYDMADAQNGVGSGSVGATLTDGTKLYPVYLTWDGARTWHAAVLPGN